MDGGGGGGGGMCQTQPTVYCYEVSVLLYVFILTLGTKGDGGGRIRGWDRWLVAEAPQRSVGLRFELGRWSFFPCCHLSEQWILESLQHYILTNYHGYIGA